MIVDLDKWKERKYEFWNRLWEDLEIGYLDEDLLPLLVEFNLRPDTYTLSSCSGRIVIVDSLKPWAREKTNVIFKKHHPITVNELIDVIRKPFVHRLWLIVSGPIIHVSVNNLKSAIDTLRLAREAGFKHSGILSINKVKGIILELLTGVKMIHLLKDPSGYQVCANDIPSLIKVANEILLDGKKMFNQFYQILKMNRPDELDKYVLDDLFKRELLWIIK